MQLFFTPIAFTKNVRRIVAGLAALVFFISCEKEKAEIADLQVAEQTYYVVEGKAAYIPIGTGNLNYKISVADEGLAEAVVDVSVWPAGEIILKGVSKGETRLSIEDLVTGQKIEVPIRVVDPFVAMRAGHTLAVIRGVDAVTQKAIQEELDAFKPFELNEWLVLQKNEDKPFFLFQDHQKMKEGVVLYNGIYDMLFSFGGPNRLALTYSDDDRPAMMGAIFASDQVFAKLFEFANGERYVNNLNASLAPSKEVYGTTPAYNNDTFSLVFDFTAHFQAQYPQVTVVEFFQNMFLGFDRLNPAIGGDILQ